MSLELLTLCSDTPKQNAADSIPDLIIFEDAKSSPSSPKKKQTSSPSTPNKVSTSSQQDINLICELFPGVPRKAVAMILKDHGGDVEKTIDVLLVEKQREDFRISQEIAIEDDPEEEEETTEDKTLDSMEFQAMQDLGDIFAQILSGDASKYVSNNFTVYLMGALVLLRQFL